MENEKIKKTEKIKKIEKYLAILYPDYDHSSVSLEEEARVHEDRGDIIEDLEAIDNYYTMYSNSDGQLYVEGKSDKENLIEAMRHAKVDRYFSILHPEYETLSPEEQTRALADKRDIIKNLDAIDNYYKECRYGRLYVEGKSNKENLIEAIRHAKEQMSTSADKSYIIRNLDAIDNYYRMYSNSDSQLYMDATEKERIEKAIDTIRKTISTTEIGKATINTPTDIKQQVAEVERGENDKQREGEEIDGN